MHDLSGLMIYIISLGLTFVAALFTLPLLLGPVSADTRNLLKNNESKFRYSGSNGLSWKSFANKFKHPWISLFLLLFVGTIAAFRGEAGVDTEMYISRFENTNIYDILQFEPTIPAMMCIVRFCGGSFAMFSLLYAFVLSSLYYYILRSYPNAIYFGIAIMPVIFIDSLYNGIRVGLAYPLVFISIARPSIFVLIAACSAHISAIIAGFFRIMPWYMYLIILLVLIIFIAFVGMPDYEMPFRYSKKVEIYQTRAPSNFYAGLADSAALIFAVFIFYRICGFKRNQWSDFGLVLLIIAMGLLYFYVIREYTAALRIVRLLVICIFGLIARSKTKYDRISLELCILFGLIYTLNFIRQIYVSYYYADGGFLPLNLTF